MGTDGKFQQELHGMLQADCTLHKACATRECLERLHLLLEY